VEKRRVLSIFISIILVLQCFNVVPIYAEKAADGNVAEIFLNTETPKAYGFDKVEMGTEKTATKLVENKGEKSWVIYSGNQRLEYNGVHINVNLNDEFTGGKNFTGDSYTLEVDYFDNGIGGCFFIYYTNVDGVIRKDYSHYTGGTNVWKTAVFEIDDAVFANQTMGGYDFLISIMSYTVSGEGNGGSRLSLYDIPIKRIKVTRNIGEHQIYTSATTDESGNTFNWHDKEKYIKTTITNYSEKAKKIKVKHKIKTLNGELIKEISEETSLAAGEIKELNVDVGDIEKCDLYMYSTEVEDENGKAIKQDVLRFAIIKHDPNNEKNPYVMINAHFDRYSTEQGLLGLDMINKLNVEGFRNEIMWQQLHETNNPTLIWEGTKQQIYLDRAAELGMSQMVIISPGWVKDIGYNFDDHTDPTDEEIVGWTEYVKFLSERAKGKWKYIEFYNESNAAQYKDGAAGITRLAEKIIPVIREIDSDVTIAGGGLGGVKRTECKVYYDEMVAEGYLDVADGISIHPYNGGHVSQKAYADFLMEKYVQPQIDAGHPEAELWFTETGSTSAIYTSDAVESEFEKGAEIQRDMLYQIQKGVGTVNVIYNFEKKGNKLSGREDNFGYVNPGLEGVIMNGTTYSPEIPALMLAGFNYLMTNAKPVKIIKDDEWGVYALEFYSNKFNKEMVTLFNEGKERKLVTVDLDTDAETAELWDEFGNRTILNCDNGKVTIEIDGAPTYLMGNFGEVKIIEDEAAFNIELLETKIKCGEKITIPVKASKKFTGNCKIDVFMPEALKLIELKDFDKSGKGSITVEFCGGIDEKFDFRIEISDKADKLLEVANVQLEGKETLEFSVIAQPASNTDYDLWKLVFDITNFSREDVLRGKIVLKDNEVIKSVKDTAIGMIPSQKTGQVEVYLPRIKEKQNYIFEIELHTDKGEVFVLEKNLPIALCVYAEEAPQIDGRLLGDEWPKTAEMVVKGAEKTETETAKGYHQSTFWNGNNDLSGNSIVMWDEDYFYYGAAIKDNKHINRSGSNMMWNGDSIQAGFWFEKGTEGATIIGQGTQFFHEIGFALLGIGPQAWRYKHQDELNYQGFGPIEGAVLAFSRDEKNGMTYYEAKFPWASLLAQGQQPKAGDKMKFSFVLNDADEEWREDWMQFTPGIAGIKSTQEFTEITFVKE